MNIIRFSLVAGVATCALSGSLAAPALAQSREAAGAERPAENAPPPPGEPDAPRRGPGGFPFGGPIRPEIKLVEKFDKDGDERLNAEERRAAREFLLKERAEGRLRQGPPGGGRGPGGPPDFARMPAPPGGGFPGPGGGPGGPRANRPPATPGPKVAPADVKSYRGLPLYDGESLRTLFLQFESPEWEKELADFKGTDVEVPATLQVDGQTYPDVGVHFRGMSSFMMVGEGYKRSLNLSLDFVHPKQDLDGYRTLNLLNSNGDPTFVRAVLFNRIAREYIPTPKANFVRVVINGESWGVYVNVQQVNKEFAKEWFGTKKGARWKAPGRPNGNSGLEYLGDDVAKYRERFEIKSKDDPKSWAALIELCRVLNQTPVEQLEAALAPHLDIEGTLRYLALDNVFINTDGYWTRASDYNLYQGEDGRFHLIPHDTNETFRAPEGPGMRRPRTAEASGEPAAAPREPGKELELDPLAGANEAGKPLLSKLLAVPALRTRYLELVREIARDWLDWNKLEPLISQYQAVIAEEVAKDTRKLASTEAFRVGVAEDVEEQGFRGPRRSISLKTFVEKRRTILLNHPEILKLPSVAQSR